MTHQNPTTHTPPELGRGRFASKNLKEKSGNALPEISDFFQFTFYPLFLYNLNMSEEITQEQPNIDILKEEQLVTNDQLRSDEETKTIPPSDEKKGK